MKPIFLELRHLKTLLALKETGSVSLAAKRVYLTQSALSHQIKLLEDQYGLPLFERKTQPLHFTPAGERLIQLANEILPKVIEAERDLARVKQGEAGELRIAVECHTCFDWLMPAMDLFRQHWPLVELDIVSGFHTDAVGLLLSHRADWAVVQEVEETPGIVYKPLFSYEMVGLCAKDHPLATKEVWQAEDFIDQTLITYPVPDDMLDLLRKVLHPKGINPTRRTSE
ncbi:LysR family transcriptional regulator, partial [Aggregatibacter sp.]